VHEWPDSPPADGFNPHGISVRPEVNLMVTSDFVNPITTLVGFDPPVVRGSVRVWDLANRTIVRTIHIPGALGTMDVKLIPGDPQKRAITAGMYDGRVYLVDTQAGTSKPIFDTAEIAGPGVTPLPQIQAMTHDGTRVIFPLLTTGPDRHDGHLDPEKPFVLDVVNLAPPRSHTT
jgi:selenium-binding protein 1